MNTACARDPPGNERIGRDTTNRGPGWSSGVGFERRSQKNRITEPKILNLWGCPVRC
jgi:hypothetical protein